MPITMSTEKPVAVDSPDHQYPLGTAQDNSTDPVFNEALFSLIPARDVRLLDIGCSGGGFVKSVLDAGGFAVGVEGSDYSQRRRRAEWATIPGHLFTADATVPFQLSEDGRPLTFNVITAWEFLEHIADEDLDGVFENIQRHLAPQGMVITSVCPISCLHTGKMHAGEHAGEGVELHQTAQPESWWRARLADAGFTLFDEIKPCFTTFVRGFPRDPDSPVLIFTTPAARRIPRLFHEMRQDDAPLSPATVANGESWRRHHPDWEWRLWTGAELAALGGGPVEAMRREILRRHGGVCPDLSVECRRPLDPHIEDVTAFTDMEDAGATLSGIAGHPLFDRAVCSDGPAAAPVHSERLCRNGQDLEAFPPGRHAEFQASPATVSVCIPALNDPSHLGRCVESILSQTFGDFQALILTDTQEAFAAASALSERHPRVIAYRCAGAVGGGEALNRCLELAPGEYVQFVTPADTLHPAALGLHAALLGRYEHVVVSASAFEVRLRTGECAPQNAFDRTLLLPTEGALSHAVLNAGALSQATPLMFRRDALTRHGLRFRPDMCWAAVYDLVLRLLTCGDLGCLHERGGVVAEATALPRTTADRRRHFLETCGAMRSAVARTAFPPDVLASLATELSAAHRDIQHLGPLGYTLGQILTGIPDTDRDAGTETLLGLLADVRAVLTGGSQPLRLAA